VIPRYFKIVVEWLDEDLNPITRLFSGDEAIRIQHEVEHLNGVMLFDHLSPLKRSMILRKINKVVRLEKRVERTLDRADGVRR
jgi:peptide deformylase